MTDIALQPRTDQPVLRARVAIVEDHDLLAQSLGYALANLGVEVHRLPDVRAEAVLAALADVGARGGGDRRRHCTPS